MQALKQQMLADGVLRNADATLTAFAGGVSSDVYLVRDGATQFVVKQVLATLRVREHWAADTSRIFSEQNYLRYAGERLPGAVPKLLDTRDGYFTMEYLGGFANWKSQMLAGEFDVRTATEAGRILGTIHRVSKDDPEVKELFSETGPLFFQLRLSPYLLTTASRHPELKEMIEAEAERLAATKLCLVHGDYSPKNMLVGDGRVVVLDCETAWFGDPCFDVSFLLTHLLLKGLYHAPRCDGPKRLLRAFVDAYFSAFALEADEAAALNRRVGKLVQMIVLARVDGKSPAEYLTADAQKNFIRAFVNEGLRAECTIEDVAARWFTALEAGEAAAK